MKCGDWVSTYHISTTTCNSSLGFQASGLRAQYLPVHDYLNSSNTEPHDLVHIIPLVVGFRKLERVDKEPKEFPNSSIQKMPLRIRSFQQKLTVTKELQKMSLRPCGRGVGLSDRTLLLLRKVSGEFVGVSRSDR